MNWTMTALQYIVRQTVYRMLPYAVVADDGWGRYTVIQDAIDAGHKWIMVKEGEYPVFTLNQDDVRIEGAGRSTWVYDRAGTGASLTLTGDRNIVSHMSFENLSGGGSSDASVIQISSAGADNTLFAIWIRDADGHAILTAGPRTRIILCTMEAADLDGVYQDVTSDNSMTSLNHIKTVTGGDAIVVTSAAEDNSLVGNVTNDQISDSSSTSTLAGNEQY